MINLFYKLCPICNKINEIEIDSYLNFVVQCSDLLFPDYRFVFLSDELSEQFYFKQQLSIHNDFYQGEFLTLIYYQNKIIKLKTPFVYSQDSIEGMLILL